MLLIVIRILNLEKQKQKKQYNKIKDKAEELGTVYSLNGFQNAINNDDLSLINSFILID